MVELCWDGKYDADGNRMAPLKVALPLQTVEIIDKTAQDHPRNPVTDADQQSRWRNRLIQGDKKYTLPSLLPEFAGKIDLIYLDPPFGTGGDFAVDGKLMYPDRWANDDEYLRWLDETLQLVYDLLCENGSLYLHLAHHIGHYARALLDEVFGRDCFQNEIIWYYRTGGATRKRFARKHDNIFFYSRSPVAWTFVPQKERSYMQHRYGFRKSDFKIDSETGQQYSLVYTRDVWEIAAVGSATHERVGYPTQKPERLLERIISASSQPGDLVLDCFCGSGTTGVVAGKLGRRWILSDRNPAAIDISRQRLQHSGQSFVVQRVEKSDI